MTPFFITLHLDPNGGSITEGTVDIKAGGSYGLLPSAYREGYIFAGWFTAPEEHTLYAHWIKKKADKKSHYSRQKVQKKVIVTLAIMTVVLGVVLGVVKHIVGITTYEDVDGTKYKIMKKDGVLAGTKQIPGATAVCPIGDIFKFFCHSCCKNK